MKTHHDAPETAPRRLVQCRTGRFACTLMAMLLSFTLAGVVSACGGPTAPSEPFPGLEEAEWDGLVFSAAGRVVGDSLVVEVTARNPSDEAIEIDLPVHECMGWARVYAEGDWDQPVIETKSPFGGWCMVSRDESIRLSVPQGGSFTASSWVYPAWPLSELPPGPYRAAIRIRPGHASEADAAPVFLLQAGQPFDLP